MFTFGLFTINNVISNHKSLARMTSVLLHETSCQLGVYTHVQDDARRVSREHRDVVTSSINVLWSYDKTIEFIDFVLC